MLVSLNLNLSIIHFHRNFNTVNLINKKQCLYENNLKNPEKVRKCRKKIGSN